MPKSINTAHVEEDYQVTCVKCNSRYGDSRINKVMAMFLTTQVKRWEAFLRDLFPSPRLGLVPEVLVDGANQVFLLFLG